MKPHAADLANNGSGFRFAPGDIDDDACTTAALNNDGDRGHVELKNVQLRTVSDPGSLALLCLGGLLMLARPRR